MNITQMKHYKRQLGYSLEQLSELSGVPRGTLQKIFSGETKAPRHETLKAIEKVLEPAMKEDLSTYFYGDTVDETQKWYVAEQSSYVAEKKLFTLKDYYALPEGQRVELIDGRFYDMAAPSVAHQMVSGKLLFRFMTYISEKGGRCIPLAAPLDVQLDCDDYTMVEPDFLVVCDKSKITRKCVVGAPDFIVEILSPSNRATDTFVKLKKYAQAGVREYWIADPDKGRLIAYFFEEDDVPVIYGADAVVPVKIFGGELQLSVAELLEGTEGLK